MWRRAVCSVKLAFFCRQLELRLGKGIFLTTVLFCFCATTMTLLGSPIQTLCKEAETELEKT